MRNLIWRGLAVALAGCIGWLLWNWPAPAEPVEFVLEQPCGSFMPAVGETIDCLWEGKPAAITLNPDGSLHITTP